MAGCSIWLIPPAESPITHALSMLISTALPPLFASARTQPLPRFQPHLTLTSSVPPNIDLSSLLLPWPVNISFTSLVAGATFFTKLTIHADKTDTLVDLAVECRKRYAQDVGSEEEVGRWGKEEFTPHVSLVYADSPQEVVQADLERLREVVHDAGVVVGGQGYMAGWTGGKLVLVDCQRPVDEWTIIQEREL